eukprot:282159-Karenia_brevis.AAC.1
MLKKARRKDITNINPLRLLKYTEQWRLCESSHGINLGLEHVGKKRKVCDLTGILFTEGITTDKWQ